MVQQYGKEKGDTVFWSTVNKRGLDETKPMKGQKGKSSSTNKSEYGTPRLYTQREAGIDMKKMEEDAKAMVESMTKGESIYQPKKEDNTIFNPADKKEDEHTTKVVTTGGGKFNPWYKQNRPYGPPRSPDQDKVANIFTDSIKEIQAAWDEKEKNKKDNEDKFSAYLHERTSQFQKPKTATKK